MRCRVKICGLTRLEDVACAVQAGAHVIGLVFASSPRRVEINQAVRLAAQAPSTVEVVGVFQNQKASQIREAVQRVGLSGVQIHGELPPNLDLPPDVSLIRAYKTAGPETLEAIKAHWAKARSQPVLLDSALGGGSGIRADWVLAAQAARQGPIWLAGGLDPDCVADAIKRVRPYGVDVSSGVEIRPGIKDPDRMRRFCKEVRRAGKL